MNYPDPILMNMSNADYHAKEDISASDLKSWVKTCPKVWHQLKYGDGKVDHAPVVKKAFRDGELAHAFTLESERAAKDFVICPNKTTKAGKAAAEEIIAQGKEPISQAEYDLSSSLAASVHAHPTASKLLSFGQPELSYFIQDQETGLAVKARPDWICGDVIVDLKTTGEGGASPDNAIKTIARYLYHLQAAHYLEVTKASEFYFVFVEKVYPFAVGVYSLDDDTIAEGRALRSLALKQISQCHTDNYWRGYSESVETLSLPNWAYLTN